MFGIPYFIKVHSALFILFDKGVQLHVNLGKDLEVAGSSPARGKYFYISIKMCIQTL